MNQNICHTQYNSDFWIQVKNNLSKSKVHKSNNSAWKCEKIAYLNKKDNTGKFNVLWKLHIRHFNLFVKMQQIKILIKELSWPSVFYIGI